MFGLFKNLIPVAPLADAGTPGHRTPQRLAGTGTTESSTAIKLRLGHMYILYVGATGVRIRFSSAKAVAASVDPTRDIVYGPWSAIPFVPDANSIYVYAEAADGAAAYECFVVSLQG